MTDDIQPEGGTVTAGKFEVSSNTETPDQIRQALGVDSKGRPVDTEADPEAEIKEAAKALGKKGGEAAAAKRAEAVKTAEAAPKEPKEKQEAKPAADETDEDEEPEAEAKDAEPAKKDRSARARMLEATRAAAELKRENARLRQMAEDAARRAEAAIPKPQPAETKPEAAKADEGPQRAAYADDESFVYARLRWEARQEAKQEFAELQRRQVEEMRAHAEREQFQTRARGLEQAYERARKENPELSDDAGGLGAVTPTSVLRRHDPNAVPTLANHLAEEIFSDPDNAHRWLLYFDGQPDEFDRLTSLPNARALLREMGKIDARFDVATAGTTPRPTSKAKPPVRPVAGTPFTDETDDDLTQVSSLDEYVSRLPVGRRPRR